PSLEPPPSITPTPPPAAPTSPGSAGNVPALGTPRPAATIDPRGVAPAGTPGGTEPRSDSYEEEGYSCQAGETLGELGKKFFFTGKYAEALRRYNLAGQSSENLRPERPAMTARQTIRIPPARILERLYATSVPGLKPAATPTGNSRTSYDPPADVG